jgi:hypothetical protein
MFGCDSLAVVWISARTARCRRTRQPRVQHLDRHGPVMALIVRLIDRSHPARSSSPDAVAPGEDFVRTWVQMHLEARVRGAYPRKLTVRDVASTAGLIWRLGGSMAPNTLCDPPYVSGSPRSISSRHSRESSHRTSTVVIPECAATPSLGDRPTAVNRRQRLDGGHRRGTGSQPFRVPREHRFIHHGASARVDSTAHDTRSARRGR